MAVAGTLEQRVTALEQEVAALQGSEALQPNYLTVTPNGLVGAAFPGGVQMHEQPGPTYSAGNALGWLDSAGGGQIREFILGALSGLNHLIRLQSLPHTGDQARLDVLAQDTGPVGSAQIAFAAQDSAGGVASGVLMNSAQQSSFLQLAGAAALEAIDRGNGTFVFTASASSGVLTIPHGLGRIPGQIFVTIQNIGQIVVPAYGAATNANFPVIAYLTAPATVNVPFSWEVIG